MTRLSWFSGLLKQAWVAWPRGSGQMAMDMRPPWLAVMVMSAVKVWPWVRLAARRATSREEQCERGGVNGSSSVRRCPH